MRLFLRFGLYDAKHIFRDKLLIIFLFAPFLLWAFARWAVPVFIAHYPIVEEYSHYVVFFAAMQTSVMVGFIYAFLFLEEKDEQLVPVLRVLPVSPSFLVVCRLSFATLFSFLGALLLIQGSGYARPGWAVSFILAIEYALLTPIIALIVATFAQNKIEGMAFFKGIDLLLLIPILSFFVPSGFHYFFAILPTFFTFQLYDAALFSNSSWIIWALVGLLFYGVVLMGLVRRFRK